ncbi:unnamed protein product [Arctia plantaginis]|uniref:Uncharacterized protein n=1 Tax=Arctia plantaginis TaxID=874455 RepID=A0A8S1A5M9_ARCPL|nr:unnamed protein product [Arctia plantaginis]CAB3243729.1 unnamed protein product [Arctia plantaginis]
MEECQSDIANQPSSIKGWTKDEKFYLLQALKAFRSHDIERIHEYINTKTPHEILLAINHYKKIASEHPIFDKHPIKPKKYCKPRVPLTSWAKLLTDNFALEELRTESATAVRMIAELEMIPDDLYTEHIDFRKVYHTIANAMEGKSLQLDKITVAVLNKCIVETALSSKAFIKTSSFKYFLNSIDFDKEAHTFHKPTENQELTVLRHLASQRNYNPLRVQENYLKPTCERGSSSKDKVIHKDNV